MITKRKQTKFPFYYLVPTYFGKILYENFGCHNINQIFRFVVFEEKKIMACPCKVVDCNQPEADVTKKPWRRPKIVEEEIPPKTFFYFAYGSNLLKKRIHINNPSAVFVSIGRLDNHRLDFIRYSETWRGASATIVPTANAHVWGTVWKINKEHMESLDQQEGVDENIYFPKEVTINIFPSLGISELESELKCRVYQQTKNPEPRGDNDPIPHNRLPSKTYLQTIIKGAIDCQLPEYYIEILKKIKDNNNEASQEILDKLKEDSEEQCEKDEKS